MVRLLQLYSNVILHGKNLNFQRISRHSRCLFVCPISVAAEGRGKGLTQAMFLALRRMMSGREGIHFIRRDTQPHYASTQKMGLLEIANFVFNVNELVVLSYIR